jgi:hypothetical protein
MTITLDYTDLTFEDGAAVMQALETDFQYDLLYARFIFRVDAVDFSFPGYTTLLDLAASLRRIVDSLADGETSSYESPVAWEKLTFARSGDQVAISASYTDATATVGLAELKEAVSAFYQRVTDDLLAQYPGLDETPGARPYFAQEPSSPESG